MYIKVKINLTMHRTIQKIISAILIKLDNQFCLKMIANFGFTNIKFVKSIYQTTAKYRIEEYVQSEPVGY